MEVSEMAKIDKLNDFIVEEQIIWQDKKRILGMPISFTKYSFSENRLFIQRGFFKSVKDELLMYRILDVRLKKSFGQRLFRGCGAGGSGDREADSRYRGMLLAGP